MYYMIIIVTGTPGTGKTILAKKLAKALNHKYIDVKALLEKSNICDGFDSEHECLVVDPKKLSAMLVKLIKKSKRLVIDSHLSHYLPKKYVDTCVVCKCDLPELKKRLKERGYKQQKIRDNLDAEIFDVCLTEAQEEYKHNVIVVNATERYKISSIVGKIHDKTKSSST